MIDDFYGAVSFMTIFGKGDAPTINSRYWFGPTGMLIGLVSWVVWHFTQQFSSFLLGGVITVLVIGVVTGGIHFDGLADSADGLLAHLEKERRFEVMAEPAVGTFGTLAVVLAVLLMASSFSNMSANLLFLMGVFSLSRTTAALTIEIFQYVRPGGIVTDFTSESHSSLVGRFSLIGEEVVSCLLILYSIGPSGLIVVAISLICWALVMFRAKSLLGGYTGDILGASIVIIEAVALVAGAMILR